MPRARALPGPIVIAAAVWCAAGRLAPASPDAASARVAIGAAWWIPLVAFGIALAVPAWRRRPVLALPALVSTLPWWPVPLPAVALIWTGPLAWLPIGVAVVLAVGSEPLGRLARALEAPRPARSTAIAGAVALVCSAAAAWSAAPRLPSTDEPHYLLITQSLLEDHDLRVENNRRQGDYHAYYPGDLSKSDYLVTGANGEIYSIHAPGLPAIVLPAFAAFGYRGAQATVMLLAVLGAMLVWRIGWIVTGDAGAAWFAWAAITLSVTWLVESFAIFPDAPAACATAVATWLVVTLDRQKRAVGTTAIVAGSACLAVLPWLHTRFAVLAAGFGVAILVRLLTDRDRTAADRIRRALAFIIVPVLSAVCWFWYFHAIYGTFNPAAPYGDASGPNGTHLQNAPGGMLGMLVDGEFGILAYTPVLAVAAIGWWRALRGPHRRVAIETATLALLATGTAATYWMWWAGRPAPPARFITAILPIAAVPLSIAWRRADAGSRRLYLAVLGLSLAIAAVVLGVDRAGLAWNDRDAQAQWLLWLGPVVNLRRAWPSFFWALDINNVGPDHLASEWPFAIHAGLWIGVWVGTWLLVRRVWRGRATTGKDWSLAVAVWLIGGLTTAAAVGWWWTGTSGLDAARMQVGILAAARRGEAVHTIRDFRIGRSTIEPGWMAIGTEEPGHLVDPPPDWFTASDLPVGDYDVDVQLRRPASGRLTVQIGDARSSTLDMDGVAARSFPLHLTAPGPLAISPDEGLRAIGGRVRLVPR